MPSSAAAAAVKAEKGHIHSGFPSPLSLGCFAEHKTAVTFHISDEQISINSRWEEKGEEEAGKGEKKKKHTQQHLAYE